MDSHPDLPIIWIRKKPVKILFKKNIALFAVLNVKIIQKSKQIMLFSKMDHSEPQDPERTQNFLEMLNHFPYIMNTVRIRNPALYR